MKHQQVSVDYMAMAKTMVTYAFLAAMGWLMLRLFNTVFMLPRRLQSQHENMEQTLAELQRRFPGLNFTEQDIKDAEKELEEIMKEHDEKEKKRNAIETSDESGSDQKFEENMEPKEDKKSI